MTYEPPTEGTPEEEPLQSQEAAPTPTEPTEEFAEEDSWDEEEPLVQPQEEAYLAGNEPLYATAPAPHKFSGVVSAVTVVLLALGLIAATLVGLKLHRDKQVAAAAAGQLLALVSEGAPAEMVKELSGIQADLAAGKVDSASGRIATLRTFVNQRKAAGPEGEAAGAGEAIPEAAYKDLPADAAQFFRANQDLFRRFLMLCTKSRELRDAGQNVDALRTVRDEIIEAARLGQKSTVQQKMIGMLKLLGGKMNARQGKGPRGPLAAKAQQLREVTNRARREGRDIRPVFALMQQAEQAAQSGDMTAAGKFLDEALVAARRAPKLSAADARRMRLGGNRRGPRAANPLAPFVRALLGVMGQEEKNLRNVSDDLLHARGILFGQKPADEQPELLKPIIDKAMGQLNVVAARRKQLQMQMQQTKRPNGKPLMTTQQAKRLRPGAAPNEEQRKGLLQIVSARVGLLLDRIRAMSDDEYAKDRKQLVRNVLEAVFEPPTPEEQAQLAANKPQKPLTAEQRAEAVKAKMLKASPALRTCEIAGKDTKPIEALFAQARKDLYAGKLDEAEKAVDEAMQLLGLAPPPPPAATSSAPIDPIKIDLRAKPR